MRLLIYGSREFADTVSELATKCGHDVAGMVDDFSSGPRVIGTMESATRKFPPDRYGVAVAIGYSNLEGRWNAWKKAKAYGYHAPPLVHPASFVADSASVREGAMVMAGAVVDVRADIGEMAVLWPSACINHDVKVGNNCFVSPNATVCGYSTIGDHSFLGAGAVVIDHIDLPQGTLIKASERYPK